LLGADIISRKFLQTVIFEILKNNFCKL